MKTTTVTSTCLAGGLMLAMLSGCERRASPLDLDQSPVLYQGPLTVVREGGGGRTIQRSDGAMLRYSTLSPDGSIRHRLIDGDSGRFYQWSDGRPDLGVKVREAKQRAPMAYWGFQTAAQKGSPCSEAGETGRVWRIHRPKNFKQDERISEACITEDGVVLSQQHDRAPGAPAHLDWRATKVVRGPVPPGAFLRPDWPQHYER